MKNKIIKKASLKRKASPKRAQKGGVPTLPSEYFGAVSGRFIENGSTASIGQGTVIAPNLMGPQLGGGFQYIYNPLTQEKVSVRSKLGKLIINEYKKRL